MRRTFITTLLLLSAGFLNAQVLEPVSWTFTSSKATAGNDYEIVMTAAIEGNWHLYAMDIAEGGPIATSFTFEAPVGYTLTGKPTAIDKPEVKFDNSFGMDIGMHSIKAEFRQKISVTAYPVTVKGFVTFMSCDDKQCLPPRDVEFEIQIRADGATAGSTTGAATGTNDTQGQESVPATTITRADGSPVITAAQSATCIHRADRNVGCWLLP